MLLSQILNKPIPNDVFISEIHLDSRKITKGNLFVALKGANSDGHKFIKNAISSGASAVVCQSTDGIEIDTSIPIIAVNNLENQLANIAQKFYSYKPDKQKIIGVTGTNGKTSISSILQQSLSLLGCKSGYIGTLGYGYDNHLFFDDSSLTTPDIFSLYRCISKLVEHGCKYIILEASSHALDQNRLQGLIFDYSVFSNLSHEHLDYHLSLENYFSAKKKIFSQSKKAIINNDDSYGRKILNELKNIPLISYGTNTKEPPPPLVHGKTVSSTLDSTSFELSWHGNTIACKTQMIGDFSISNLTAVCGVCLDMGYSLKELADIIPKLKGVCGRIEKVYNNPFIFIDYAHTPDALEKVLSELKNLSNSKVFVVFGCGGDRDKSKRPKMGNIANTYSDRVFITNDNPRTENPSEIIENILAGIDKKDKCTIQEDRAKAIADAISEMSNNDCLLIAGKGHETGQYINGDIIPYSDHKTVIEIMSV